MKVKKQKVQKMCHKRKMINNNKIYVKSLIGNHREFI